jgi:hypothetical protein
MRLFLARRTRSFIKNNYAVTDPANGRKYIEFPGEAKGETLKSYFPDPVYRQKRSTRSKKTTVKISTPCSIQTKL